VAVHATRVEKEQAANNKEIQEQVYTNFRWFDIIKGVHKLNGNVRIFKMVFALILSSLKPVQDEIMICEKNIVINYDLVVI
jgi:hypothetical protein